jgi:hypothetical protein
MGISKYTLYKVVQVRQGIGSMARDHEAYGKYGHPDLTGTTLTLYGKQKKTRTVEISSGSPVLSGSGASAPIPNLCL